VVVLVTGAGAALLGLDLKALSRDEIKLPWFPAVGRGNGARWNALRQAGYLWRPWRVLGGGLQFTLACDMRIAAEDAFFQPHPLSVTVSYPSGHLLCLVR